MSSDNPSHHRRPSSNDPPSQISESQILPSRPPPTSSTPTQPLITTTSSSTTPDPEPDPEPDLPLSMSTSLLLVSPTLPTDARTALANLSNTLDPPTLKVAVRFHAIGAAPQLKQKVFKISASSKFGAVVGFLRKRLYGGGTTTTTTTTTTGGTGGMAGQQGLFCYVNSVFAPGLDEGVGNLWRCFRTDEQLIVGYSVTPAFG